VLVFSQCRQQFKAQRVNLRWTLNAIETLTLREGLQGFNTKDVQALIWYVGWFGYYKHHAIEEMYLISTLSRKSFYFPERDVMLKQHGVLHENARIFAAIAKLGKFSNPQEVTFIKEFLSCYRQHLKTEEGLLWKNSQPQLSLQACSEANFTLAQQTDPLANIGGDGSSPAVLAATIMRSCMFSENWFEN
jgi:hemerythrin-like domain-containing protein